MVAPVHAQEGSLITSLQDEISGAARGWEQTVSNASRSLFWILASIEIGLAAIWLALQAPSLQEWFAELVRRIMFVGFFALVLERGPAFAKAVVDSLFQIGASGGDASPADIFNAGLVVAGKMAEKIRFGLFEDNALAVSAAFATIVVVIAFSLVAAIFVAIMAEMYIGLLAGMIMLGLGGSSFTKDFAIRYLVYAFSVGMKLMALVMIARI
ncbi:MAG: P-type conjugative transfer protein TrbL, partial [Rhizobium sp.]